MLNRFTCFLTIFLLVICYQTLQTNADECIDMNVYANEVVDCCKHEPFCDRETNDKCAMKLSAERAENTTIFTVCFIDCAYREMGFLVEDYKVDVPRYIKFLEWFDKGYQNAAGNAFTHCATLQESIRRDVEPLQLKCSAFALLFNVCVMELTMQNCPGDRWMKGELCDKVKKGCAFDCVYRAMGFLEGQYEIIGEKINARQAVYDETYQKVFANAVDYCVATKDKMVQDAEMLQTACSSFAVKFHACIILKVMQNCPADRWDASPLCEQIQKGAPLCTS
ncbi:uncharacterized protein LOC126560943 [Anopheles maculipalpis]|uniref:uncharacterized protein LOC126560943 n=1 Tax=Anopheles maculipalpis TaxID=1496333 RepID=UPI0021594CF8|nr:uncharacterized protein LOC126560943 [Anopheles maculipalpis]